jgi:hypothetical protein
VIHREGGGGGRRRRMKAEKVMIGRKREREKESRDTHQIPTTSRNTIVKPNQSLFKNNQCICFFFSHHPKKCWRIMYYEKPPFSTSSYSSKKRFLLQKLDPGRLHLIATVQKARLLHVSGHNSTRTVWRGKKSVKEKKERITRQKRV